MTLPRAYARIVGSKWTSTAPLLGWRQFHVVALRRAPAGWEAELAASVEPARRVWVFLPELRNRERFSPGWSTLAALRAESGDVTEEERLRGGYRSDHFHVAGDQRPSPTSARTGSRN